MKNTEAIKCVIVIDADLPLGLIANTAAVLSLTLGHKIEGIIGPNVVDGSGKIHEGITTIPFPILKGSKEIIKEIRRQTMTEAFSDLFVVDFSNAAQTTKDYQSYTEKIATLSSNDLEYLGVAIYGDKKKVNKLTGSMPLLR